MSAQITTPTSPLTPESPEWHDWAKASYLGFIALRDSGRERQGEYLRQQASAVEDDYKFLFLGMVLSGTLELVRNLTTLMPALESFVDSYVDVQTIDIAFSQTIAANFTETD
ncbi:MAG: hypothetical protein EPO52_05705 [Herbiconiux sp.]|uniref:hypothetical protein n=1 Tax=Herbiconiux sp. TaxID=1871186 RepID=UPI0011FCFC7C|nr:hypothetical protein [Herbiconiux sp.]TAJ48865.1 MAG: hypothetical protein EPO52_05705 [Herbiconiux sp.]